MMLKDFKTSLKYSRDLDLSDPLRKYRKEFHIPENTIYLDGNSLGLCPKKGETSLFRILDEWKTRGIHGWLEGENPWFFLAEEIGKMMAPLVGAHPEEVICTGTTTVNQHALLSTFYKPDGIRTKILADEKNFPSDIYAIKSHLKMRGYNPREHLILVGADKNGFIPGNRITAHMTHEVALALFPSVFFRTGQLLDISKITREAHKKGIIIGFDCSHSVGSVQHSFSSDDIDFAFWCGYKYLNGGPGCPASLYINKRHFGKEPLMAGWFGYNKQKQFEMSLDFEHQKSAGGWQISTPAVISMAPLEGSLSLFLEAGMDKIREKSIMLTTYLIRLVDELLHKEPYAFHIGTPRNPESRGGHVAVRREKNALQICEALKQRNIVPDFRPPDIIRIAPSSFYNRFEDIWILVKVLRDLIDNREYEKCTPGSKLIT
ncbi:MAG: kynureninase [Bacteroidales bacterium]|nr:MAG: kynureninase [Bacteroidales bacterium]